MADSSRTLAGNSSNSSIPLGDTAAKAMLSQVVRDLGRSIDNLKERMEKSKLEGIAKDAIVSELRQKLDLQFLLSRVNSQGQQLLLSSDEFRDLF